MFFDHNGIILEINNRKVSQECSKVDRNNIRREN